MQELKRLHSPDIAPTQPLQPREPGAKAKKLIESYKLSLGLEASQQIPEIQLVQPESILQIVDELWETELKLDPIVDQIRTSKPYQKGSIRADNVSGLLLETHVASFLRSIQLRQPNFNAQPITDNHKTAHYRFQKQPHPYPGVSVWYANPQLTGRRGTCEYDAVTIEGGIPIVWEAKMQLMEGRSKRTSNISLQQHPQTRNYWLHPIYERFMKKMIGLVLVTPHDARAFSRLTIQSFLHDGGIIAPIPYTHEQFQKIVIAARERLHLS